MEEKKLREKLYSLVAPLKPSQFAIEQGAKSDEQIIEEIIEDVKRELDKAREETRQEERDMFIVRYATVSFNEAIKTIKTLSIIEFLSIKWGLKGKKKSKLTTK